MLYSQLWAPWHEHSSGANPVVEKGGDCNGPRLTPMAVLAAVGVRESWYLTASKGEGVEAVWAAVRRIRPAVPYASCPTLSQLKPPAIAHKRLG